MDNYWLTERYKLYAVSSNGIYEGFIHHRQWPLQPVKVTIEKNSLGSSLGVPIGVNPSIVHYADNLMVRSSFIRKVGHIESVS
ncbi:uncharacterized protein YqjF (DUF2071 family) [Evansella vedderi]|uniref:Uncharacterized protein YqjF (DUF2071 family) n=1 Tax=Evansella vedderi TaxID=38282 RepID=A0ABT9ZTZ4_9BACI|nr:DUF2071 domain-containing protein [Evansella vedderi]MDQ0254715.1 uncharacterized protein YqjF (DUF2071 family) [Evansella vedderi]